MFDRIIASSWNVSTHRFAVTADISTLTAEHGPGVYGLTIWGRPDHMNKLAPVSMQSVFWRLQPPEGHPYR